jgi:aminomethyltransferase
LKKTPLYNEHIKACAKIVKFAGFAMPLDYGSSVAEHMATRTDVGCTDVSHMQIIDLKGTETLSYLQFILVSNIKNLKDGRAIYTCMCNDEGGIIDDLIVYKISKQEYRVILNAKDISEKISYLQKKSENFNTNVTAREDLAIITLQGKNAKNILCKTLPQCTEKINNIKKFCFDHCSDYFITRTGYTGEDGFEIITTNNLIENFWQKLMQQQVQPVGLSARDSLRLEAGMRLSGADMNKTTTPLDCALGWMVDFTKKDFVGKKAIKDKMNSHSYFCGLVLEDKGILRGRMKIYEGIKKQIGEVTSGGYSPLFKKSICLARLEKKTNTELFVKIRNNFKKINMVKLPFLTSLKLSGDNQ